MNGIPKRRAAPSAARLMHYFKIDKETAEMVRTTITAYRTAAGAVRQIAQNQWIGGYGAEDLIIDPYALPSEWSNNVVCTYINMGDTYDATLIARNGRVFIGTWGDLAKRHLR